VRLGSFVFTASVVLLSFLIGDHSIAGVGEEQVCDVAADYSLGVEDYQGDISRASLIWHELIYDIPDYEPARTNLAVRGSPSKVATAETAAVNLPRAAAVDTIIDER
jgi:hypothetical protein